MYKNTDIEILKEQVKILDFIDKGSIKNKQKGPEIHVSPCPICGGNNHFSLNVEKNLFKSFTTKNCSEGGSVIDFIMAREKMSKKEAISFLNNYYLEKNPNHFLYDRKNSIKSISNCSNEQSYIDYESIITKILIDKKPSEQKYFLERGISVEVIEKFSLFCCDIQEIDKKYFGFRAIIPYYKNGKVIYVNSRRMDNLNDFKYMKLKNQNDKSFVFNEDCLENLRKDDVVFVTEGEINALSFETLGFKAVALGGVSNLDIISEIIKKNPNVFFISCFDNDDAGNAASEKVEIPKLKIPPKGKSGETINDINDWLRDSKKYDGANWQSNLHKIIKEKISILKDDFFSRHNISTYIKSDFCKIAIENDAFSQRKTGFNKFDEFLGGLFPGLTVIGGGTGMGKTTFVYQIAENLASFGEHILFYTLEQKNHEFAVKSLAMKSIENNLGYTNKDIRSREDVRAELTKKFDTNVNLYVFEDANNIKNDIKNYINRFEVKPIVIIDYIQIYSGDNKNFMNTKDKMDATILGLNTFAVRNGINIILISSINRNAYFENISYDSFKETGAIEYTANVLLGLDFTVKKTSKYMLLTKAEERKKMIFEASNKIPREISLYGLKNRYGKKDFSVDFIYYPANDFFKEL